MQTFTYSKVFKALKFFLELPIFFPYEDIQSWQQTNKKKSGKELPYGVFMITTQTPYEEYIQIKGTLTLFFYEKVLLSTLETFTTKHFTISFSRTIANYSRVMPTYANMSHLGIPFVALIDKSVSESDIVKEIFLAVKANNILKEAL